VAERKIGKEPQARSNYYLGKRFRSLEELRRSVKRYCSRYNNISRKVLKFKSPNEMLKEYRTNN